MRPPRPLRSGNADGPEARKPRMSNKAETSFWKQRTDWLLGVRPGFGDGRQVIDVAQRAGVRRPVNWTVPVLGILFVAFLIGVLKILGSGGNSNGFWMLYRVFVIDYSVFCFGLLSGWDMARRWRSSADQIEELSLSAVPPAVVGHMMSVGGVTIWAVLIAGLAVIEALTPVVEGAEFYRLFEASENGVITVVGALMMVLAAVGTTSVLALFHLESVRLAHWMFAVHALPRISLVSAGISNFFFMSLMVLLLSGAGSAVTGTVAIVLALVLGAVGVMDGISGEWAFSAYLTWSVATIPGAVTVLLIKRALVRFYERAFMDAWLQFQWWGAGEARQPKRYPLAFRQRLPIWRSYYLRQEEETAGLPAHRRVHTQRYNYLVMRERGLAAQRQMAAARPGDQPAGQASGPPAPPR